MLIGYMGELKLVATLGAWPEIIRISAIIKRRDRYFGYYLVHTGQNYDHTSNEVFFKGLALREPDHYLNVVGENIGQTMANVISKSYELMVEIKPDAVIVLGDTNSCLSIISVKRLKIPIFHVEAGNRCKGENLPEEVVRKVVDVTSDVNLCHGEHVRRYVLDAGVRPENTYVVGSPMRGMLDGCIEQINSSRVLECLGLERHKYILLPARREENIGIEANFFSLMNVVNVVADEYNMPILYSCHPRSKKFTEQRGFKFDKRVTQSKPLGFHDYNYLQQHAFCVVSDSGIVSEEASFFKFPTISIRTSTKCPEATDKGVFVIGSISTEQVLQAVDLAVKMHLCGDYGLTVPAYDNNNVSTKVVELI